MYRTIGARTVTDSKKITDFLSFIFIFNQDFEFRERISLLNTLIQTTNEWTKQEKSKTPAIQIEIFSRKIETRNGIYLDPQFQMQIREKPRNLQAKLGRVVCFKSGISVGKNLLHSKEKNSPETNTKTAIDKSNKEEESLHSERRRKEY